ncbi:MAG: hypothetical protein IPG07_12260 [Crocinitomicaceae bacterium]|nr:hypothetical protein [Crocinitomicaceae bacterium]MBK6953536.1 hypothetical protein [Crocinitomicaceae bacterium]
MSSLCIAQTDSVKQIKYERQRGQYVKVVNGKLIEVSTGSYHPFPFGESSEYDSTGRTIAINYYQEGDILYSTNRYELGESGYKYKVTITDYNSRGEFLDQSYKHKYIFMNEDSSWQFIDSIFNEWGELERVETAFRPQDNSYYETISEHIPEGTTTRRILENLSSKFEYTWVDYGPDGKINSMSYHLTDTSKNTYTYYSFIDEDTTFIHFEEYDKNFLPIYERDQTTDLRILEYWFEYEFDAYGNWIKKLVYDANRNLIFITEREIVYW